MKATSTVNIPFGTAPEKIVAYFAELSEAGIKVNGNTRRVAKNPGAASAPAPTPEVIGPFQKLYRQVNPKLTRMRCTDGLDAEQMSRKMLIKSGKYTASMLDASVAA